jgi:predicted GIY-YIG superfamily endonuclease
MMQKFYYVYILRSDLEPERFYVGQTQDIKKRVSRHIRGEITSTAKYRPWKIQTAIALDEPSKAVDFERYLKSASGRAFAKKRF